MAINSEIKPILKWVGGKKQIFPEIKKKIPKRFNNYFEPFLGGGFVLFSLQPKKAHVNDLNEQLINVYRVIKGQPKQLIDELRNYKNESDFFYAIRSLDRDKAAFSKLQPHKKAARILYLNKTCYNGLYRVNSRGELNAPFGRYKNPNICNEKLILGISKYLNSSDVKFSNGDFDGMIRYVKKNDFVYLDPPYDPISDSSSFTGYNAFGFDRRDQKRLKSFCDAIDRKGAKFMLSNSATDFVRKLYENPKYKIHEIDVKRMIAGKNASRTAIKELLICNY